MRATVVAKTSSAPGVNGLITFTIQRTLTFNAGATYKFELNSTNGKADEVAALRVGSTRLRRLGQRRHARRQRRNRRRITVGTGSRSGAFPSPGYKNVNPGTLTIHSTLTFTSDATYEVGMNSSSVMADEVVTLGVTINSGAQCAFVDLGSASLPAGTAFTVINNTAATPIAGTFSNLPDGSTFTSNGNSYAVDYQGGSGNDLTLTVVP